MLDFTNLTPEDFTEALRGAGSLVRFHATSWQGTAADFAALESVRDTMNAKGDFGTVRKKLLANNDAELKELNKAINAARTHYYRSTGHWSSEPGSPRLLPNENCLEFITSMAEYQKAVAKAKAVFVDRYPEAKRRALLDLGKMADPSVYPDAQEIANKFTMAFHFEPVPDSSGFRNLPDMIMQRLSSNTQERAAKRLRMCFVDGLRQIEKSLVNAVDRLSDPEKVFRNTLLDNIVQPARTVRPFNIVDDQEIADLLEQCIDRIGGYDLEDIRNNMHVRKTACDECASALEKVRAALTTLN